MKRKLTVLTLLLCTGFAYTQELPKEKNTAGFPKKAEGDKNKFVNPRTQFIVYDFSKGDYTKDLLKIKVHTPVVFIVENVNPFAYNVHITPKDSIMASSFYDLDFFKTLNSKDMQAVEEKLVQDQNDINKSATAAAELPQINEYKGEDSQAKKDNKTSIDNSLEFISLQSNIENLKSELELKNLALAEVKKKAETDTINYDNEINNLNTAIKDLKNTIAEREKSIIQLNNKITKTLAYNVLLDEFSAKYQQYIKDCRDIFKIIRTTKQIDIITENPNLQYEDVKKSNLWALSDTLYNNIEKLDNYHKSYSELSNAFYKLKSFNQLDEIMEPSGVSKTLAYPIFLKTKADQLSTLLSKFKLDDLSKQALWAASILKNEESFRIKSYPIQPENDLVQFMIEIKKRNSKELDKYYKPTKFTYQQPTYGGTRVDLSLGLAAAYYHKVDTYEINNANYIDTIKKNVISPSLIGLITMSTRKTGYITYGGSAGMGLDVTSGKVQISNFFIGPTALLGKRERIFLTLGASLKNVRQLKSTYNGVQVTNVNDLTSYTKDFYKIGFFASITYSLTKDARAMIKSLR
ncbi:MULTISPECIES: hypothetical protein [unclassified Sphingobacterium]|uniref:hypothetical protein n=1 Tax=unclassified Sphingobacterium TaxID=2609468 RepID=UPI0025DD751F|nr:MULTISPECIES: hypothetical protein [unclassified Sphingobacterium]